MRKLTKSIIFATIGATLIISGCSNKEEKEKEKILNEMKQKELESETKLISDKVEADKFANELQDNPNFSGYNINVVQPNEMYSGIAHSQNGINERTVSVVQGQIKLSNYYNYDFTESEKSASIQITDKNTFQTFYGYANREVFDKLIKSLGENVEMTGTVVLIQTGEYMDNGEESMATIQYLKLR